MIITFVVNYHAVHYSKHSVSITVVANKHG